jgi:hypothetical protein
LCFISKWLRTGMWQTIIESRDEKEKLGIGKKISN